MKVEIGESLIYSWLRHVQGCVLAQLNWKPSPTWDAVGMHKLEQDFNALRDFVDQYMGVRIFKDIPFRQFIHQAEIDALGLRFDGGTHSHVLFAVDSAFHENGLQHGGSEETVARMLKKLVRSAFACRAYFQARELHLVFATPKMHTAAREAVEGHLAKLVPWLLARWALGPGDIRLRVVVNEDFTNEVLRPVLRCASTVADTSELFLRAQQLLVLCGTTSHEREVRPQGDTSGSREEEERIGLHVRSTMAELAKSGCLTPEVIGNLLDERYCKSVFRLNYPFLRSIDPGASLRQQRIDDKGYARFWKDPVTIGSMQFLVCNQWFDWQRGPFDAWVRQFADQNGPKTLP